MKPVFELWDWDVGHIVNAYLNESDALAVVTRTVEEHGQEAVETWILLRSMPGAEDKETVAMGPELAALALRDTPARAIAD